MANSPDRQWCSFAMHFVQYFPDDWSNFKDVPCKNIAHIGENLNVILEATIESPRENGNLGLDNQYELFRKQAFTKGQQCISYLRRLPPTADSSARPRPRPKQNPDDELYQDEFEVCSPLIVMNISGNTHHIKKYDAVHISENVVLFPVCLPLDNLPIEACKLNIVMQPPWIISTHPDTVDSPNSPQIPRSNNNHQTHQLKACASLDVVAPPHTSCQHLTVGGKNYTIIRVSNKYSEAITINDASMMINRNNHFLPPSPDGSTYQSTVSNVTDYVHTNGIHLSTSSATQLPLTLQPLEQNCFLFQLDVLDNIGMQDNVQSLDIPLLFSLQWKPCSGPHTSQLLVHYELPTLRLDYPAFVMLATCSSPVIKGQIFSVQYTLVNKLQDFVDIGLLWLPAPRLICDSARRENGSIEDVVICQEPIQHVGMCKQGSTVTVTFVFHALRCGVYELGKFMKLKLQYASSNPNRPSSSHDPMQHSKSSPALKELTGGKKTTSVQSNVNGQGDTTDTNRQPADHSANERIDKKPLVQKKDAVGVNQWKSVNVNKITKRRCQVYIIAKQS